MKYLSKKMIRDLRKMWLQFLCVLIMAFGGILVYAGMEGLWNGVDKQLDYLYEEHTLADAWIYGSDISDADADQIRKITSVSEITKSMEIATDSYNNSGDAKETNKEIKVIATDDQDISSFELLEGEGFRTDEEGIWLDNAYAKKNGITVGEFIPLIFKDSEYKALVIGLILHPEYVKYPSNPDHDRYGYAVMNEMTANKLFGKITFNLVKVTAEDKIDLEKFKGEVEKILGGSYISCLDRETNINISGPVNYVTQIKVMSIMFSGVFLLLALLTMETTMSRLVENQRIQIGTMKAIGFSDLQILMHYASYGLLVTLLGGTIGVLLAPQYITPILFGSLKSNFTLISYATKLTPITYLVLGFIVIFCTLTAAFTCRKIEKGMPADIMRGKSPRGNSIILEKFKYLWSRLPFDTKWSLRDVSRNKVRTIMGVIGVLGSLMLMISGLGMHFSTNYNSKHLYGGVYTYEDKAYLQGIVDIATMEEIDKSIDNRGQWIKESPVDIMYKDQTKTAVISIIDKGEYTNYEVDKGTIELDKNKTYVTIQTAKALDIKAGDKLGIRVNGEKVTVEVEVADIINIYAPQGIIISRESYENLGMTFTPTAVFLGNGDKENLLENESIKTFVNMEKQLEDALEQNKNFVPIFMLMIFGGMVLGIVILYNLGILNYTERNREYATLKVLGFYQKEITSFALKETIITIIFGLLVGIPFGLYFLSLYTGVVSNETMYIEPHISGYRLFVSIFGTAACALCVSIFLSLRVRKINMVEALKSVE